MNTHFVLIGGELSPCCLMEQQHLEASFHRYLVCLCHIVLLLGTARPGFSLQAQLVVTECLHQNSVHLNLHSVATGNLKYPNFH